ncbi:MAG: DUF1178 family protein [Deltaproteobacteria bacterium]|nr:DUF1178 family protein [Deltaproteobacteria bacterium]
MIVFDLICANAHVFEGWFDSNESFEDQNLRGLIRCPVCDDSHIHKALSPVAVKKSQPEASTRQDVIDYQRLAKEVVDYIKANSEDVGAQFTSEALKIHYGVAKKRSIRGSATADEEKTLREEGVEFVKLPFPVSEDDSKAS